MAAGSGAKATIAALAANIAIAIAKFVAFVFTGSASMLAESIHSVADSGNQTLLLVGVRRSKRAATAEHPFGYGRERYFWSFIVAMVLFSIGGVFSVYEGYEKLRHPHEIESLAWALGVLGVAIVLEAFSFRTAIHEANEVRGTLGWWRFIRHSKAPELPVLLLEDLGALVGLIFAFAGVAGSALTHDGRFDALGSLSIGILLCVIAVILAIEMKSLLIGEAATPADMSAIERAFDAEPNVVAVVHLRTVHMGPDQVMVGAKIRVDPALPARELSDTINRVEVAIRRDVKAQTTIYIEPDTSI